MKRLDLKDVHFAKLELSTSRVMYDEIDVDDLAKYKMGSEQISITQECCDVVNKARVGEHKICGVGTSTMKALETALSTDGFIKPYGGWTGKFIYPEYTFGIANSMVTGFHMPYSSTLLTAVAFGGYDHMMNAYKVAIKEEYRFGCYGDAMLII